MVHLSKAWCTQILVYVYTMSHNSGELSLLYPELLIYEDASRDLKP